MALLLLTSDTGDTIGPFVLDRSLFPAQVFNYVRNMKILSGLLPVPVNCPEFRLQ